MTALVALARVPVARLLRARRGWMALAAWSLVALAAAVLVRSRGVAGATYVVRGTFGGLVVPLLAYGLVSAALGGAGLRRAVRELVHLGAPPRLSAVSATAVAVLASAAACGALGAIVAVVAHGASDPPLVRDALTTLWVSGLGGAAYAAFFAAGSALGQGAARGGFLVVDWLLGSGMGVGALFTPRGHLTSLLGGPPCADLSQRVSSVLLVLLALAYGALAVRLARRGLT